MTKKFLGIFKRDKTGFSNEELEWQAKIGTRGCMIAIVISCIVGVYPTIVPINLLGKLYKSDMNDIELMTVLLIMSLMMLSTYAIVVLTTFAMSKRVFRCKETNAQLQKNLEEKEKEERENKKEKVLSCLEKRDFLELGIDWLMIDRFFQLLLIRGIVEMIPSSDGVEVSISKDIQDIPSFSISRDELLDYFDVDNDEEE